jgi:hypothetical protein
VKRRVAHRILDFGNSNLKKLKRTADARVLEETHPSAKPIVNPFIFRASQDMQERYNKNAPAANILQRQPPTVLHFYACRPLLYAAVIMHAMLPVDVRYRPPTLVRGYKDSGTESQSVAGSSERICSYFPNAEEEIWRTGNIFRLLVRP